MNHRARVAGTLFVVLSAPPSFAQVLLQEFLGPFPDAEWGKTLASVGDVNLDGRDDVLVSTYKPGPNGGSGFVWLYSGIDGQLIWNWTGVVDTSGQLGRAVCAAGDVNQDGVPDLLMTAPQVLTGPRALVYSGADASLLRSFVAPPGLNSYGDTACQICDTNADGTVDFAIGAPLWIPNGFESGRVYVFSGATSAQRYLINGGAANDRFGWSIASAGDVDGDGVPDFAVGAPQSNVTPAQPGYVEIRSGANGALVRHVSGASGEGQFGTSLAALGDLDGDGKTELAVGAPRSVVGGLPVGTVGVISSATGVRLATYAGTVANAYFGYSVSSAGDVDRDGKQDLLIGIRDDPAPAALTGSILLVCTRDGRTIMKVSSDSGNDRLGWTCASGDVNGDGYPDIIGGAPSDASNGKVRVWSTNPVPPHTYCVSAPNSQTFGALIGSTGSASVAANNLVVTVTDAIANGPGILYYGVNTTQVPFGAGWRCVGGATVRLGPPHLANGIGAVNWSIDVTQFPFVGGALPVSAGTLRYFQYWYRDSGSLGGSLFNLTNALAVTFCP